LILRSLGLYQSEKEEAIPLAPGGLLGDSGQGLEPYRLTQRLTLICASPRPNKCVETLSEDNPN